MLYDQTKLATAAALLVQSLYTEPTCKALATALLSTVRFHKLDIPPTALAMLIRVAGERSTPVTESRIRTSYKRLFAVLNPLMWSAKQINDAVHLVERKNPKPGSGWVANYRTTARSQFKDRTYLPEGSTNVSQPIDPETGHFYCDTRHFPLQHISSPFYLFYAQQWALALFAGRMTEMYGDNHPCPYSHMTAAQFRQASTAPVYVLAYEWLKHTRRKDGVTLPIPVAQYTGTASTYFDRARVNELVLGEAARYGHAGQLDMMAAKIFILSNAPTQNVVSGPQNYDTMDDDLSIPALPHIRPLRPQS